MLKEKHVVTLSPSACKLAKQQKGGKKTKQTTTKTTNHGENSQMPCAQAGEPLPRAAPLPGVSQLRKAEALCQATLAPIRKPSMKRERALLQEQNASQTRLVFTKLAAQPCLASCRRPSPGPGHATAARGLLGRLRSREGEPPEAPRALNLKEP